MEPDPSGKKKLPACPRCGNRLRLRPDQVGTEVMCPKCNARFLVGRPGAGPAAADADSHDDAYEPEIPLARSSIVPEEEMIDIGPAAGWHADYGQTRNEADQLRAASQRARLPGADEDHLATARARGLVRDVRLPDPPKWTFFSGVFGYPWQGVNLARWAAMAFGLSVTGMMFWMAAEMLGLLGRSLSPDAIMGLFLAVLTIAMGLATFSFSAACFLAALQDTADGHLDPQESSVPDWDQWLFTLLSLVSLWAASAAIGFPFTLIEEIGPAACFVSSVLVFPVLLLSALEADSYLLPYSRPVLATLVRCARGWLMFYLITTALLAGWIVALDAGLRESPYLAMFLSGPVAAALILIYARLLGRLAWRASGAPMAPVETGSVAASADSSAPARKRKKQRVRIHIEIPDEPAAAPRLDGEEPPPRISFHRRS